LVSLICSCNCIIKHSKQRSLHSPYSVVGCLSCWNDNTLILINFHFITVKHAEGKQVLWKNIETFNGHVFSHIVSFATTELSRTKCAISCWSVPLCISFTYDENACKGYSEKVNSSTDFIASLKAFYYAIEYGNI
jgi:hypothetical protein